MTNCSNCNVSCHKSTNEMYARTKGMNISTIFDRYQDQQPQCGFGMQGVCCQLCSHGPCRITPCINMANDRDFVKAYSYSEIILL